MSISNGGERKEEEETDKINGEETDKINGEERDRTIKSKTCGSSCKVGRELWWTRWRAMRVLLLT